MPRPSRKRLSGQELVDKLNQVVAQLIKENRQLKRQVDKLSARGASGAPGLVDRNLRAIQRRAQKALATQPKRRRQRATTVARTPRRGRPPKNAT
jgi:hypothetical protein